MTCKWAEGLNGEISGLKRNRMRLLRKMGAGGRKGGDEEPAKLLTLQMGEETLNLRAKTIVSISSEVAVDGANSGWIS